MPRPSIRRGGAAVLIALSAIALSALTGCDVNEDADTERGRQLFSSNCGTCHALAQAGTSAQIGPDLDASFADARASGMDNDTIEGVVQSQISNPRTVEEGTPDYESVFMPADIVTGQDAEDVAAYVASVAGVPGAAPPEAPGGPGGQVFANNGCGACHVFEAAGSGGTAGPDLDEVLPGQSAKEVEQSIVDPDAKIAAGFAAGIMPSTFGGTISPDDLKLLVDFLVDNAGKGGGGGG